MKICRWFYILNCFSWSFLHCFLPFWCSDISLHLVTVFIYLFMSYFSFAKGTENRRLQSLLIVWFLYYWLPSAHDLVTGWYLVMYKLSGPTIPSLGLLLSCNERKPFRSNYSTCTLACGCKILYVYTFQARLVVYTLTGLLTM